MLHGRNGYDEAIKCYFVSLKKKDALVVASMCPATCMAVTAAHFSKTAVSNNLVRKYKQKGLPFTEPETFAKCANIRYAPWK